MMIGGVLGLLTMMGGVPGVQGPASSKSSNQSPVASCWIRVIALRDAVRLLGGEVTNGFVIICFGVCVECSCAVFVCDVCV